MEIDTAVRFGLPMVAVIGNDGGWGQMRMDAQAMGSRPEDLVATELGFTRYDKMAEALGGYGEYVENPSDIRPALERAFGSGKPAVVNVKIDPAGARQVLRPTRGMAP
jgi:acetolactate synthase-1/2/3 large subunit